jgi:hypothetical protein
VLPHQSRFSSKEAFERLSGPEKWNRQQGFYIYRADRMIQSGGWSGLRAVDEHRKLARIAISFPPKLDDEFKINVAKMRVSLPSALREIIAKAIGPAVTMAEEEYRQRERKGAAVSSPAQVSALPQSSASTYSLADGPSTSSAPYIAESIATSPAQQTGPLTEPRPIASSAELGATVPELRRVGSFLRNFVQDPSEEQVLERLLSRAAASME